MFKFHHDKEKDVITYEGEISNYIDKRLKAEIVPEIIDRVATRYVEENYNDIIKLVDTDAFKANLTIALTVQASQKIRSSL